MITYKVIFDYGKPHEEIAHNKKELKALLKKGYELSKENIEMADVFVFEGEKDISESQFINELVADIIGGEDE